MRHNIEIPKTKRPKHKFINFKSLNKAADTAYKRIVKRLRAKGIEYKDETLHG